MSGDDQRISASGRPRRLDGGADRLRSLAVEAPARNPCRVRSCLAVGLALAPERGSRAASRAAPCAEAGTGERAPAAEATRGAAPRNAGTCSGCARRSLAGPLPEPAGAQPTAARRAGRLRQRVVAAVVTRSAARRAQELRRRADRLAHHAETIAEREPCRDTAPERNRLRGAAAAADQRARLAERMVRPKPAR